MPDDRMMSSGPKQARLRDLEGQGSAERSVSAPTATNWVPLLD